MFNRQSYLTVVIGLIGASAAYKSYQNYTLYMVQARNENDLNFLHYLESTSTTLNFWDRIHHVVNSSYRVMVPPEMNKHFVKLLSENNIENHIITQDLQKMVENEQLRGKSISFDFKHFWTYHEVSAYLDYLANTYANYTNISVIGKSGEGREIHSIHIKGDQRKGKSQTILVDATMHAREWISTMTAVFLIHELVENRANNLNSLSNFDWVIVPIINPDGYVYTHEYDRFWRKTRSVNPNTPCIGVDPNRNFDFHWDTPGASSTNPCSEAYRGFKPHSSPEVMHLSNFLVQHSNAILYLTLHSYGGYLLYPYGYDYILIENHKEHQQLGNLIRDKIYRHGGYDYKVGNSAKLLYAASGASDDYAAGVAKIPFAYTLELPGGGTSGFDIPASRINSVVTETFEGIKELGDFFANKI